MGWRVLDANAAGKSTSKDAAATNGTMTRKIAVKSALSAVRVYLHSSFCEREIAVSLKNEILSQQSHSTISFIFTKNISISADLKCSSLRHYQFTQ